MHFFDFLKEAKNIPSPQILKNLGTRKLETVVGGTFDILHIGHETLLITAFEIAKKVHLCIMSDEGIKSLGYKKYPAKIRPFRERKKNIIDFLAKLNLMNQVIISKIEDPYSYAIQGQQAKKLDSIVISSEKSVIKRTKRINILRQENALHPLDIFRIPMIFDTNGTPFSSSKYRNSEKKEEVKQELPTYYLTDTIREIVSKPVGEFVKSVEELPKPKKGVIAIGDVVTKNLIHFGYPISIAILDRKSKRAAVESVIPYLAQKNEIYDLIPYLPIINPSGIISKDSWYKIYIALTQPNPMIIRIFGEEDLMGFPATLIAPEGTLIIYGQPPPKPGLVYFFVNDDIKERVIGLLERMKKYMGGIK